VDAKAQGAAVKPPSISSSRTSKMISVMAFERLLCRVNRAKLEQESHESLVNRNPQRPGGADLFSFK